MPKDNLQPTAVVASLFGVSERRIQQLASDGIIEGKKVSGVYKFDLLPTIKRYIAYLSDKANGRNTVNKKAEEDKLHAEAALKQAKAEMAEIQLKELQGKMHRSDDVEAIMTDLVYTIRSMIIALPGRLAVDVAEAKTASEASEIIRKECHILLNELSNYKYDPAEYAKRVRDREGWQEIMYEDND